MSSIWKDLNLNPRVESCFTCLHRVSSFLCTFKLLGYQPPNDVASRLFSFALNRHLELTFQYDGICQLKALPHRVQNVFWQEWDSNPRTHSCTRFLDWGVCWVCRLRPLGHPACLTSTFLYIVCFFNWVDFSIQRYNLLSRLCHPFEKNFVETHVYFRGSNVFAGYLLCFLCIFKPLGYQPRMTLRVVCFFLLWTVILNWPSSMTEFVGWRLCLNVFKTFSDRSGIRTHAHGRVPEFSTEGFLESGALERSGILPGLRRRISFWYVSFQLSDIFNSEM